MNPADVAILKRQLKLDEGLRLFPYDDATGKPLRMGDTLQGNLTIGWGRALSIAGITQLEAETMLDNDIEKHVADLERAFPIVKTLDPARQIVLGNMAYNMGLRKLASFKRMWDRIRAEDFKGAAEEMLHSRWSDQVGVRATRLAAMMASGDLKQ